MNDEDKSPHFLGRKGEKEEESKGCCGQVDVRRKACFSMAQTRTHVVRKKERGGVKI